MFHSFCLPHVGKLFCSVASERFHGNNLSATGVGTSAEKAGIRRDAELAEAKSIVLGVVECRKCQPGDVAALGFPNPPPRSSMEVIECAIALDISNGDEICVPRVSFFGSAEQNPPIAVGVAAGTTPDMALSNAILEAVERHSSLTWWFGGMPGNVPSQAAQAGFESLLVDWVRDTDRRSGLLDITTSCGIPGFVAWSCEEDGRGLCFGTACRLDELKAVRAAVRELLQMEFGLGLVRYKRKHGATLTRKERMILARTKRLRLDACEGLLKPHPTDHPKALDDDLRSATDLARHLSRQGNRFYKIDLVRSDDFHWAVKVFCPNLSVHTHRLDFRKTGGAMPWTKWELY